VSKLRKIGLVFCLAIVFCLIFSAMAVAATGESGYIIGGYRYLSSEVLSSPTLLQELNGLLAGSGYNNLVVDLGGGAPPFNYSAFMAAGGLLYPGGYAAYATANPATVPPYTQIKHPDGTLEPDPEAQKIVDSVEVIADINVANGTATVCLPMQVNITDSNGNSLTVDVTWDGGNPPYDGNTAGTYVFTGTLNNLPNDVTNPNNKTATVNVIVGQAGPQAPAAPAINPNGGSITTADTVGIDATLSGNQAIYYTNDGTSPIGADSNPSVSASVYAAPFSLSEGSQTVEAAVYDPDTFLWSTVTTADFQVTAPGPLFISSETDSVGDYVYATFSKDMSISLPAAPAGFMVMLNGTADDSVVSVTRDGSNPSQIDLELDTPVIQSGAVTLDYDSAAGVQSADGGVLESFTGETVDNKVPEI